MNLLLDKLKSQPRKRILFVCLGNICRSAAAEEIMRVYVRRVGRENEILVDSAGIIGYHRGDRADPRMRMHASRRGYNITHRSRPVRTADFYDFDLIVGMDYANLEDLRDKSPDLETQQKIVLMSKFCRNMNVDIVPDPYYGGEQGFENVLDMLEDACQGLLDEL